MIDAASPRRWAGVTTAPSTSEVGQRPSVLQGLRELAAVVGSTLALSAWAEAAAATGVHGLDLDEDEHLRLLSWLGDNAASLPVRAVARSLSAQLRAHRVLAAWQGGTT